jgi:hypothetical protein
MNDLHEASHGWWSAKEWYLYIVMLRVILSGLVSISDLQV